jgi:two-component system NtrC family sensor kinase
MAAFSRFDGQEQAAAVDVNDCLLEAISRLNGGQEVLSAQLADSLPPVWAGREELVEATTELLTNGLAAAAETPEPRVEVRTYSPNGDVVFLQVEDNGPGVHEELRDKVFTPFFTTDRRVGRPGLGLSKAYALIKSYDGDLFYTSRPGRGAVFTIKLPAASREVRIHEDIDRG